MRDTTTADYLTDRGISRDTARETTGQRRREEGGEEEVVSRIITKSRRPRIADSEPILDQSEKQC